MKLTKSDYIVGIGYAVTIIVFWFLGAEEHMGKATAFFGLAAITGVYAGIVRIVKTILAKKEA